MAGDLDIEMHLFCLERVHVKRTSLNVALSLSVRLILDHLLWLHREDVVILVAGVAAFWELH